MKFFTPVYLSVFFFVSGYLSKSGIKFADYLEQRTRTLFIPFLFWGLIILCKRHLFTLKDHIASWSDGLKSFFLQDGSDDFIWFIPALYVFSIIYYWFDKFSKNDLQLILSLTIFATINWLYLYIFNGGKLPYHLEGVGFACLLMGLGKVYRRHEALCSNFFKKTYIIFALITYLLICGLCPKVSYTGSKYMLNWIIATASGLYLMIYISKLKTFQIKLFLYIGANTLLCFILHGLLFSAFEYFINSTPLGPMLHNNEILFILTGLFETFLITVMLIIPIWIINKYLPFTIGKGYKLWK